MTAAWNDQLCRGRGKSCRTTGILSVLAACSTKGAARRHCGHCRSSKTTKASCDPLGGRRAELASCATAHDVMNRITKRNDSSFLFIMYLDAELASVCLYLW